MSREYIKVGDKLFVGRVEEQKQFCGALTDWVHLPAKESLPYVCLIYGEGGMGKTLLARRFQDIAQDEAPFVGEFQALWIDWEDERKKYPGLQVGRDQINVETVFKVIHAPARDRNGAASSPPTARRSSSARTRRSR